MKKTRANYNEQVERGAFGNPTIFHKNCARDAPVSSIMQNQASSGFKVNSRHNVVEYGRREATYAPEAARYRPKLGIVKTKTDKITPLQHIKENEGSKQKRLNDLNKFEICNKLLINMNIED